jgi:hypothetical protein
VGKKKKRKKKKESKRGSLRLSFVESSWIIQLEVRGLILHLILLGFDVYVLDLGEKWIG